MTQLLEAGDIVLNYGERPVLRGVSIQLRPGEIVALVGANGAGKSSLLKTLAGLVMPTRGRVTLDGQPLASIERNTLSRQIAYLPQERTVHWPLSVRQLVALGRLPHRHLLTGPTRRDAEAVERAMLATGVQDLADRPAFELSGGERARVLLARAIAQEATYMIADEPSAGLDPAHELTLFERLAEISATGRGIIVALHDLSLAARFCHRAILLQHGTMLAAGRPDEVLTPGRLAAGFGIRATVVQVEGAPIIVPLEALP